MKFLTEQEVAEYLTNDEMAGEPIVRMVNDEPSNVLLSKKYLDSIPREKRLARVLQALTFPLVRVEGKPDLSPALRLLLDEATMNQARDIQKSM